MDEKSVYKKALILTYFSFTTLSLVGFGDYYPTGNSERIMGSAILLLGVGVFTFMLGDYILIIN